MGTDPRKMGFWTLIPVPPDFSGPLPAYVGGPPLPRHAVDRARHDSRGNLVPEIETCRTVYPKHDLGQWCDLGILRALTYATIETLSGVEFRVLHPCGDHLALHAIRTLE